jgi:hypothetical protein
MTVITQSPPAPVGQQGPPTFAAARYRALHVARGALPLTTGTAYRRSKDTGHA